MIDEPKSTNLESFLSDLNYKSIKEKTKQWITDFILMAENKNLFFSSQKSFTNCKCKILFATTLHFVIPHHLLPHLNL